MGLAVDTFTLAYLVENDPESADGYREDFAAINKVLWKDTLPVHQEPERQPPDARPRDHIGSFPYSWLHYLRRAYALSVSDPATPISPVPDSADPADDPAIAQVSSPAHHLLYHSDTEGFYLPIEFSLVLEAPEIPGEYLGSSHRLMRELCVVAPHIGIALQGCEALSDSDAAALASEEQGTHPLWLERQVWLTLFENCRISLEYGTALAFG